MIYRRLWMLGRPYRLSIKQFGKFDMAYREGTADLGLTAQAFDHDFFSRVPEYIPAADHVIIDIGAHIGAFSLLAASKVKQGRVFAIEACQDTFNFLRIKRRLKQSCKYLSPSPRNYGQKRYMHSLLWDRERGTFGSPETLG